MPSITVPTSIRLGQRVNWRLVTSSTSSGRGLDGRQQIITRENRYWACEYLVLNAWGKAASWGDYMAFLDQLNGMGGTFTVPVPNINSPTYGATGDLFLFDSESMGFVPATNNAVVYDSDPNVTTESITPAGATQITSSDVDVLRTRAGTHFAHNDFLYRIASTTGDTIKFNPPLRSQIAGGQTLQVKTPTCRVRLASEDAAMAAHEFSQIGGPYVLSVVEAFDR